MKKAATWIAVLSGMIAAIAMLAMASSLALPAAGCRRHCIRSKQEEKSHGLTSTVETDWSAL